MKEEKLKLLLSEYGADVEGLTNRFCGDLELYESCLRTFLAQKEFSQLKQLMNEQDYEHAFPPAHALKGMSGNLGLIPLYELFLPFVEELRNRKYDTIISQYKEIIVQRDRLEELILRKDLTADV